MKQFWKTLPHRLTLTQRGIINSFPQVFPQVLTTTPLSDRMNIMQNFDQLSNMALDILRLLSDAETGEDILAILDSMTV